jgi:hypothetical protein
MDKYIGVKMIEAEPMSLGEYKFSKMMALREDEVSSTPGYRVQYDDGYISWSPKASFESAYLKLNDGASGKITHEDVIGFVGIDSLLASKLGEKTTVVLVQCLTGFDMTESAACVDPANFVLEKGIEIALDKIKDQLWGHLGFVLQWAKNGLKKA